MNTSYAWAWYYFCAFFIINTKLRTGYKIFFRTNIVSLTCIFVCYRSFSYRFRPYISNPVQIVAKWHIFYNLTSGF